MSASLSSNSALHRELSLIIWSGSILLLVFAIFFIKIWPVDQILNLAVQSCVIWLLCLSRTSSWLELNRVTKNAPLYATFGWANRLSLLRAWLIALTAGFIFQPNLSENILYLPALSYFLAAVIDRIDGFVARVSRQQSLLGEKLDTEFDALGLLVAPLLAVWIGQIHWSYLSVSLAYYLYQAGLHWRKRNNLAIYPLPKNPERRAIAGFQMGFLAVVLWPILAPPATTIAGFAFMFPLLVGFLIDWLTSNGTIRRDKPEIRERLEFWYSLIQSPLLPAMRIGLFLLMILSFYHRADFLADSLNQLTLNVIMFVCVVLILLGYVGRLSALILSCLYAYFMLQIQPGIVDTLILMLSIWLMQLGTGKYSLALWDDRWVKRYDGAA